MSNKVLVASAAVVILGMAGWLFWESRRPAPEGAGGRSDRKKQTVVKEPKASASLPEGFVRHQVEGRGFSLACPQEWETRAVMAAAIVLLSPQEGPADTFRENVNVVIEKLPAKMSLNDYQRGSMNTLRRILTDFKIHEQSAVTIGGAEARRLVYSHRMGMVKIKVLVDILVRERRGYSITCSAAPEQFDEFRGRFEEIVQSFRFEE